ncbi:MAG: hypothetical protein ABSH08_13220 [Tepidisphaeraceae bacterium]|jgi:hypothetical protein
MIRTVAFLAALLLCTTFASAQFWDDSLSVGYSHFFPQRSGGLFFSKDGAYIDGDFAWRIPQVVVPTFVGVGVSASGYWDSESTDYPVYYTNRDNWNSDLNSDVEFIELEPRVAMKFWVPGAPGMFVRPRIGAGLLIDNYSVDQLGVDFNGFGYIYTLNHTGAAFEIRPAIQVGFERGPFSAGGELSYMASWGGFGAMGDVLQELRAGVFLRFRF